MDICSPQGAPSTEKGALRAKVRPHEGKSAFVGLAQSLMSNSPLLAMFYGKCDSVGCHSRKSWCPRMSKAETYTQTDEITAFKEGEEGEKGET